MTRTTPREFTLTRSEVYDLVWTTPIQKLAFEWGLSDVGLAKILRNMSIPRPGRGYWARVAAGQSPKRPRLPAVHADEESILRVFRSPLADMPRLGPPDVRVAPTLDEPHEVTRWVLASLKAKKGIDPVHRRLFDVSRQNEGRALRILDAVAKTLSARGQKVVIGKSVPWSSDDEIIVVAEGAGVALGLHDEDGRGLCLRVGAHRHICRKRGSWCDSPNRPLEALLNRAVVTIEGFVRIVCVREQEEKERAELELVERRKRLRAERLEWYSKQIAEDLHGMVASWCKARDIRVFLREHGRKLKDPKKAQAARQWRSVATGIADALDPLCHLDGVAKDVCPSDEDLERLMEASNDRVPRGGWSWPEPRRSRRTRTQSR